MPHRRPRAHRSLWPCLEPPRSRPLQSVSLFSVGLCFNPQPQRPTRRGQGMREWNLESWRLGPQGLSGSRWARVRPCAPGSVSEPLMCPPSESPPWAPRLEAKLSPVGACGAYCSPRTTLPTAGMEDNPRKSMRLFSMSHVGSNDRCKAIVYS